MRITNFLTNLYYAAAAVGQMPSDEQLAQLGTGLADEIRSASARLAGFHHAGDRVAAHSARARAVREIPDLLHRHGVHPLTVIDTDGDTDEPVTVDELLAAADGQPVSPTEAVREILAGIPSAY